MFKKNRKGALMLFGVFVLSGLVPLKVSQLFFSIERDITTASSIPFIGTILMTGTMFLVLGIFFAIGF